MGKLKNQKLLTIELLDLKKMVFSVQEFLALLRIMNVCAVSTKE
jgi:hypothetical protein